MTRRSYQQYCATAHALDIVGERWTLLLVRELLTGPKRFGDLQANLRGMGTGLLSSRLKYLQEKGLVRPATLPAPARTPAYELTRAGAELGPAVLALADWGMRWAMAERGEGEVFRPGWLVLAMRTGFVPEAAEGLTAVYEFRVDGEAFHARVAGGAIETGHGAAAHADVVVEADGETFLELARGGFQVGDPVWGGRVEVTGDEDAARALGRLFRWPEQGVRVGGGVGAGAGAAEAGGGAAGGEGRPESFTLQRIAPGTARWEPFETA